MPAAIAQSKLDYEAKRLSDGSRGVVFDLDGRLHERGQSAAEKNVLVLISLTDPSAASEIEALGVEITGKRGNILVANVSPALLEEVAAVEGVESVSGPKTLSPLMDLARSTSNIDDVHAGTGLDMPFTGKNVIAAIYDSGLEPNHVNFINTELGESRVKRIWEYDNTQQCSEYTTPSQIRSYTTDSQTDTHGTHVLGTMAGSYAGESTYASKGLLRPTVKTGPMPFYGIARDADIAIGCGSLVLGNVLSGIDKIIEYAKSENKPAVVNLSLGLLDGPQDGSDAVCKYLASQGEDVIIVMASGNDGDEHYTVSKTFTASDRQVKTFVDLGNTRQTGAVTIWGSDSRIFTVKPAIVDLSTGKVSGNFVLDHSTSNETVFFTTSNYTSPDYIHDEAFDRAYQSSNIQMASNVSPSNDRYCVKLGYTLTPNSSTNANGNLTFGIIVEGEPGQRVDIVTTRVNDEAQATLTSHRLAGWEDGSGVMSVSSMACGDNVIVVGAYNSRSQWGNLDKGSLYYPETSGLSTVGDISAFTSYGVTVNGRSLPEVCAPGAGIISSYSSYYVAAAIRYGAISSANAMQAYADYNGKRSYWAVEQGTSMACPSVSGIIALWLEADPTLTVDEVRKVIKATSFKDKFVDDNVQWGVGKIDALAGIKKVLDNKASVGAIFADDERNFILTPTDGGYNVYVAGESELDVTLYDASGRTVASVSAGGNTVDVDTSSLRPGVYILSAQGNTQRHTAKIAVK